MPSGSLFQRTLSLIDGLPRELSPDVFDTISGKSPSVANSLEKFCERWPKEALLVVRELATLLLLAKGMTAADPTPYAVRGIELVRSTFDPRTPRDYRRATEQLHSALDEELVQAMEKALCVYEEDLSLGIDVARRVHALLDAVSKRPFDVQVRQSVVRSGDEVLKMSAVASWLSTHEAHDAQASKEVVEHVMEITFPSQDVAGNP